MRTYEFDGHRIAALRVVEDSLVAAGLSHHVFKVIKWSLNEGLVIDKFSENWGKQHYNILRVNNASNHVASIGKLLYIIIIYLIAIAQGVVAQFPKD